MTELISTLYDSKYPVQIHDFFDAFISQLNTDEFYTENLYDTVGDESAKIDAVLRQIHLKPLPGNNTAYGLLEFPNIAVHPEIAIPALALAEDPAAHTSPRHSQASGAIMDMLKQISMTVDRDETALRLFALKTQPTDKELHNEATLALLVEADSKNWSSMYPQKASAAMHLCELSNLLPDIPIVYHRMIDGDKWTVVLNGELHCQEWYLDAA